VGSRVSRLVVGIGNRRADHRAGDSGTGDCPAAATATTAATVAAGRSVHIHRGGRMIGGVVAAVVAIVPAVRGGSVAVGGAPGAAAARSGATIGTVCAPR